MSLGSGPVTCPLARMIQPSSARLNCTRSKPTGVALTKMLNVASPVAGSALAGACAAGACPAGTTMDDHAATAARTMAHRTAGAARRVTVAAYHLPMQPNGYAALRTAAALRTPADRGWIAVNGSDRARFLQGLLTNDVAALEPGGGCYAAYLTPQGRMLADMHLLAEADRIVVDLHHSVKDRLLERWDDLIFTEDVELSDLTPDTVAVDLCGPGASSMLSRMADAPTGAGAVTLYRHCAGRIASHAVTVARIDELGIEGYRLRMARDAGDALRHALAEAGAVEADAAAWEAVRVESGRPAFPVDMDDGTIPLEAGITDRAIDFDKGCYVGQEVIIRVLHRGQGRIARKLAGLTLDSAADSPAGGSVPGPGAAVSHGGDAETGRVTSAVRSPALGRPIALAYLPRILADAPGTEVAVVTERGDAPAVVTPLPFV
ncbi:MAG: folate-binding protein YgfZ [Acidobacteria bacterium]|nr:folate-binding protein YgfZ [Acidobacteriota bacterium]